VLLSISVLGIALLEVASGYLVRSRYDMMGRFVKQAAGITSANYLTNNRTLDMNIIAIAYSVVSNTINSTVFFVDLSGRVVFHTSAGTDKAEDLSEIDMLIPEEVIASVLENGGFEATGNLSGFFSDLHYVVGIPAIAEGDAIGIVFASAAATDLQDYRRELIKMFLFCGLTVLAVTSVFIYIITLKIVGPLRSMLDATHSFSRGDFSSRVRVSGYDEVGQLSMAFNNMASTMATTESARRQFIANVSHELKTPITTISGFVDGILDGTIPEEKNRQYLEIVSSECKRLVRLVRSMLDTARLETGELELHPMVFDISESIRQAVFTFEYAIEEKELEIKGLEKDRVMVVADRDLMYQVIYNLTDNAVKFVNQGGYLEFLYSTEKDTVVVTVRNSGEGINKDEAPWLFDRFYKTDRSRSRDNDGVGLGLHIVKSVLRYHKSEIIVESIPGMYTDFIFNLPGAKLVKGEYRA